MLNTYQKKALKEMRDTRAVDKHLLDAFTNPNGALRAFMDFTSEHDELNVCFRGNHKAIEIYYLNHVLWSLSKSTGDYYNVKFNFGHAKDMPDEKRLVDIFKVEGFKLDSDNKHIVCRKEFFTKTEISRVWKSCKDIMDFYFDPINGAPGIEKRWQHKFFTDFHKEEYLDKGLYVYDLEYAQKLPNICELRRIFPGKSDTDLKEMGVHSSEFSKDMKPIANEPDFMGIETTYTGERYMVFGEIKSLYESCEGASGVMSHLGKMKSYMELEDLINHRKSDAEAILKQYTKIGDISVTRNFDGLSKSLKVKNVLIFTNSMYYDSGSDRVMDWKTAGGAIKFFEEKKEDIKTLAKES